MSFSPGPQIRVLRSPCADLLQCFIPSRVDPAAPQWSCPSHQSVKGTRPNPVRQVPVCPTPVRAFWWPVPLTGVVPLPSLLLSARCLVSRWRPLYSSAHLVRLALAGISAGSRLPVPPPGIRQSPLGSGTKYLAALGQLVHGVLGMDSASFQPRCGGPVCFSFGTRWVPVLMFVGLGEGSGSSQ